MRRFSEAYLARTREGLWADREALAPLELGERERVLDVGCGAGNLTGVLRDEAPDGATVVGCDADTDLLGAVPPPTVAGDATRLPFRDDAFDLVVCQALLVNLPDPAAAVREFARVSRDAVAAVEPDNAAVSVSSTVDAEAPLSRRARAAYIAGTETDLALGADAAGLFRDAGLRDVRTRTRHHAKRTEPPYGEADLEAAKRKARATRLDEARGTLRAGGLDDEAFAALAADWRAMGRTAVEQMRDERYRRVEVVPFHVVVGRV